MKEFDDCIHKMQQLYINIGRALRKRDGKPEEGNITILYDEAIEFLGISKVRMTSTQTNHLPAPWEMQDENSQFIIPRKDCPSCGAKFTFVLAPICPDCKDAEDNGIKGVYKSGWKCNPQLGGCGYVGNKSKEAFIKIMSDIKNEVPGGNKKDLGILTITDKGME